MEATETDKTNVLLAEDDDDDYLFFSLAINAIPFTVLLTRAENGEILMKLLSERIPDVLFLDIHMPCKDGHQCLKEIRADKRYDKLPIIVYSSMEDLKNIELCYREGSNLFAIKPSSLMELKMVLEKILTIDWKKSLYFPHRSAYVLNPR